MRRTSVVLELARGEARRARDRSRGLVAAVALGAGLVVATATLGTTLQHQVERSAGVENEGVDLLVRSEQGAGTDGSGGSGGSGGITAADVQAVRRLPGVAAASGVVRTEAALAASGRIRGAVVETLPGPTFRWQGLAAGRYPVAPTEVALSRETLRDLDVSVGDRVLLGSPGVGRAVFTVVGAVDVRGSLRYATLTYAVVTGPVASRLAGLPAGGATEVRVRARAGVNPDDVVTAVNASVPVGYPVLAADATSATQRVYGTGLGVLAGLLSGFALVALLVAVVVLATVVAASLPGRRRDLALLRAVGASRSQLRRSVLAEIGALALVGGLLAVPLGVGVAAAALPALGLLPGVPALGLGMLRVPVGLLLAVPPGALLLGALAGLVPAWLVGRVPPSAALREGAGAGRVRSPGRTRATTAAAVVAAPLALAGLVAVAAGGAAPLVVAGLAVAVALVQVLALPALCRALAALAARLLRDRAPVAELAAAQLRRFPARAVVAGLAATVAASTVALSWVVLTSLTSTTAARTETAPGPEVVVGAYAGGPVLPAGTLTALADAPGVADVLPVRSAEVDLVGPRPTTGTSARAGSGATTRISGNVTAATAAQLAAATDGRLVLPRVAGRTADQVAYLPTSDLRPFDAGATVTLRGPDGGRRLEVVYVDDLPFQALVTPASFEAVGARGTVRAAWVDLAPGADRSAALTEVRTAAVLAGGLPVSGTAPGQERLDRVVDLARALATGMLALSVLIAVLGAALTVATTVRERTAELAVLRVLWLPAAGVRRLVAVETWAVAVLSTLVGLALGTVLGWAAVLAVAARLDLDAQVAVPVLPLAALGAAQVLALRAAVTGPLDLVSLLSPVRALRPGPDPARGGARP